MTECRNTRDFEGGNRSEWPQEAEWLIWTEFPPLAVWHSLHYCVVKVFKGLFTPSLLPLGPIESTL